jgi:hypothetical protein
VYKYTNNATTIRYINLEATDAMCLCWNYSDVHDTLSEFKSCVVCFISGHDHDGGIAVDQYT